MLQSKVGVHIKINFVLIVVVFDDHTVLDITSFSAILADLEEHISQEEVCKLVVILEIAKPEIVVIGPQNVKHFMVESFLGACLVTFTDKVVLALALVVLYLQSSCEEDAYNDVTMVLSYSLIRPCIMETFLIIGNSTHYCKLISKQQVVFKDHRVLVLPTFLKFYFWQ